MAKEGDTNKLDEVITSAVKGFSDYLSTKKAVAVDIEVVAKEAAKEAVKEAIQEVKNEVTGLKDLIH